MFDETQEIQPKPENNSEFIKHLASQVISALGYQDQLRKAQEWIESGGNPGYMEAISDIPNVQHLINEIYKGMPDQIASSMSRIPNSDEAKRLLMAAMFGMRTGSGSDLVSFQVAEPSSLGIQRQARTNADDKDLMNMVPNYDGTIKLAEQIVNNFLPQPVNEEEKLTREQELAAVSRRLGWGSKTYTTTNGPFTLIIKGPKETLKEAKNSSQWAYTVTFSQTPKT